LDRAVHAGQEGRASIATGVAWALFAVLIWSGWFVLTRLSLVENLSTYDIAALRFGTAGLLLLPVVLKRGFGLRQVQPLTLVALVAGAGAPYALVVTAGLFFAPASHGSALTPGVMPLWVALLGLVVLGETLPSRRRFGLLLILLGVIAIAGVGVILSQGREWLGHVLFLSAALMWACYTIALRHSGLPALHGTAIVAVWSMLLYLPIYALFLEPGILAARPSSLVFAVLYQGVMSSVVSLVAYTRAVAILGPSRAAAFASLNPVLGLLIAIPVLGEIPSALDLVGIVLVSAGVFFATGAKLGRKG
jgi:drug/metabolite transporter (DMT)-like permease